MPPIGLTHPVGKTGHPRGGTTEVQSVLLPKEEYPTPTEAKEWLAQHHYRTQVEDSSRYGFGGKFWRARQFDPPKNARMRAIHFGASGIEAVVAAKGRAPAASSEDDPVVEDVGVELEEENVATSVRRADPFLQKTAAERFYDEHPKAIFGMTMTVSAISGMRLNDRVGGTLTSLELQPSTAAWAGFMALSFVSKRLGYQRTSQVALAVGLGQGLATVSRHMPKQALMLGGGEDGSSKG